MIPSKNLIITPFFAFFQKISGALAFIFLYSKFAIVKQLGNQFQTFFIRYVLYKVSTKSIQFKKIKKCNQLFQIGQTLICFLFPEIQKVRLKVKNNFYATF